MWDSKRDTHIKSRILDSVGECESGIFERIAMKHVDTICGINDQSRFDAWDRVLRAGALGQPWGRG